LPSCRTTRLRDAQLKRETGISRTLPPKESARDRDEPDTGGEPARPGGVVPSNDPTARALLLRQRRAPTSEGCSRTRPIPRVERQGESEMTAVVFEGARARQGLSVLILSTLAFTVCFMVWMMLGVIGIPIREALDLNATQFGLLTATPVLTGSLIRVPLGIWTDRYGGRIVMTLLMAAAAPAIWLMAYATQFWQFIVIGLFIGLAGGSFSVGTPYVARWFPRNRQGFAMGVYGAGNSGAAVNKFVAPALVVRSEERRVGRE